MSNHQKAPFKGVGGLSFKGIGNLLTKAAGVPRRFPVSLVFLLAVTACFIFNVWVKTYTSHVDMLACFFGLSALYATLLYLWREREPQRPRRWWTCLLAGEGVFLLYLAWLDSTAQSMGQSAYLFCLVLVAGGILIYRHEKDVLPVWCLGQKSLVNFAVSLFVGLVMAGGVSLLLYALNELFGIKIGYKWSESIFILTFFTLPLWLFLSYLPEGAALSSRQPAARRFIQTVTRWLFIPLLAVYGLVLYAYAAKILFSLTLPEGGVCWLVICFVLATLAIQVLGAPFHSATGEISANVPHRSWTSLLVGGMRGGLLLLMSVAIGRRIYDYGFTEARIYVLIFNVWAYLFFIGEFLSARKEEPSSGVWRKYCGGIAALLLALFLVSVAAYYMPEPVEKAEGNKGAPYAPSLTYHHEGPIALPSDAKRFQRVEVSWHVACEKDSSQWRIATRDEEALLLIAPAKLRALCPPETDAISSSTVVVLPLLRPAGATCVVESLELQGLAYNPKTDSYQTSLTLSAYIFQ